MTNVWRACVLGAVLAGAAARAEPPAAPGPAPTAVRATAQTLVLGAGESSAVLRTPIRIWVDRIAVGGAGGLDCLWPGRCPDAPSIRVITEAAGTGARTDTLWIPEARRADAFEYAGFRVRFKGLQPAWRADAAPGTEYRAVIDVTPR